MSLKKTNPFFLEQPLIIPDIDYQHNDLINWSQIVENRKEIQKTPKPKKPSKQQTELSIRHQLAMRKGSLVARSRNLPENAFQTEIIKRKLNDEFGTVNIRKIDNIQILDNGEPNSILKSPNLILKKKTASEIRLPQVSKRSNGSNESSISVRTR